MGGDANIPAIESKPQISAPINIKRSSLNLWSKRCVHIKLTPVLPSIQT